MEGPSDAAFLFLQDEPTLVFFVFSSTFLLSLLANPVPGGPKCVYFPIAGILCASLLLIRLSHSKDT